jgi:hypothetical protein
VAELSGAGRACLGGTLGVSVVRGASLGASPGRNRPAPRLCPNWSFDRPPGQSVSRFPAARAQTGAETNSDRAVRFHAVMPVTLPTGEGPGAAGPGPPGRARPAACQPVWCHPARSAIRAPAAVRLADPACRTMHPADQPELSLRPGRTPPGPWNPATRRDSRETRHGQTLKISRPPPHQPHTSRSRNIEASEPLRKAVSARRERGPWMRCGARPHRR